MAAEKSPSSTPSEDVPGEKWDRCVADTALKTGVSLNHDCIAVFTSCN